MDETNNGLYFIISEVSQKEKKNRLPDIENRHVVPKGKGVSEKEGSGV